MLIQSSVPSSLRALSVDRVFLSLTSRITPIVFPAADTNTIQLRYTTARSEDSRILYNLSQVYHMGCIDKACSEVGWKMVEGGGRSERGECNR